MQHRTQSQGLDGRQARGGLARQRIRSGLSHPALAALALVACGGGAVDLGDGPVLADPDVPVACEGPSPTGACSDAACDDCYLVPCACDSSENVAALGCLGRNARFGSPPLISDDGSTLAVSLCLEDKSKPCRLFHWNAESGTRAASLALPDRFFSVSGISADGSAVLLAPQTEEDTGGRDALYYRLAGGNPISTGISAPSAQLTASGVAVGFTQTADGIALARWSEARGLEPLTSLPFRASLESEGPAQVYVASATPDASTIVGSVGGSYGRQPFTYSDAGGLLVGSSNWSIPDESAAILAVSNDGSTLAGATYRSSDGYAKSAFRWTPEKGFENLGLPATGPGSGGSERPVLLSDDGLVLAGMFWERGIGFYPVRWTATEGVVELQDPGCCSAPPVMSGDGSVIVSSEYEWVEDSTRLSTTEDSPPWRFSFKGGSYGGITDLSHDGNILVGTGLCGGTDAFYRRVYRRSSE